jgi:leader peptidase (prepilin peptidase)/N-methyltransferase
VTGLAGALAGGWGLRLFALIARRGAASAVIPAGSADLAMIAGAFLGWQPILVAVVLALAMAAPLLLRRRHVLMPVLLLAIVAVWLGWAWIGPAVRPILFNPVLLPVLLAAGLALLYVVCVLIRLRMARPRS